jgi:hypothetical protein
MLEGTLVGGPDREKHTPVAFRVEHIGSLEGNCARTRQFCAFHPTVRALCLAVLESVGPIP